MDPMPPSAAMRASSSAAASARSPRHSAQKAAVIAWWAADAGGAGPVGERPGPLQGPPGVVVEAPGGRLPGQHLHGHGGVGRVAELLAELGCLAGVGEGAGVVPEPGAAGRHQRQARDQHAERAALAYLAPGAVDRRPRRPRRSPRKPAASARWIR